MWLVNQYPKVSHAFIRREILALERRGIRITRVAVRGWDAELVDADDVRERVRTRYLLQRGAAVLLAAMLGQLWRSPQRFARALFLTCRISRGAARPLVYQLAYLAEACLLVAQVRALGATHIHAHFGTNAAAVALLAAALGGPPYSFTVHGPEEFDQPLALALPEKVRAAAFVVAVSAFGRSQLYRWLPPAEWPKVREIRCGIDDLFRDVAPVPIPDAPRLVCVGRLCAQKGQLLLVDAVAHLAGAGLDVELVLAGDGELRAEIERRIDHHGLHRQVRITGWLDAARVRDEILAARALVLPSFAEGLPVVLMEAMAVGRPVISTYVAGIPELVAPGINGWLCPAGSLEALCEAIAECLRLPAAQLEAMGRAGRARVLLRHDGDREAAGLAALLCPPGDRA